LIIVAITSLSCPAKAGHPVRRGEVDAMLSDVEAWLSPFGHNGRVTEILVSAADIIRR